MAEPTPSTFLDTIRVLCLAMMGSLVAIMIAVVSVSGFTGDPPLWALGVVLVVGAAAASAIPALGYRTPAIPPATPAAEAQQLAASTFQKLMLVRFALAELVAFASVPFAVAVEHGGSVVCVLGVAVSVLLLVLHAWPSDRVITRVQEALERDGGQSYLREALDAPPPSRRS